jgi:hypothetical protein
MEASMLKALALVACLGIATLVNASVIKPSGFYVMQPLHANNPELSSSVIGSPALTGVHVRDKWSLTEPSKGVYSWIWLDGQINRIRALGKGVTLGVYNGGNSPTWTGAPLVDGTPLPWDSRVTSAYVDFVAQLGAHFSNNPAIHAVHINSPATSGSMEMFLPVGLTSYAGYSDQKVIDVWKLSIDAYAAAFPNSTLVLDIAMAPNSNGAITKAVDDYAWQKLGSRLEVIMCSLKASTSLTAPHVLEQQRMHSLGVVVGDEMVGPSSDTTRFGGTFAQALSIGKQLGDSWYQIYQGDISNIPSNFFPKQGDYNSDGVVDSKDYTTWKEGFGGSYDASGYVAWRKNLPVVGGLSSTAIPEPDQRLIVLLALFLKRRWNGTDRPR